MPEMETGNKHSPGPGADSTDDRTLELLLSHASARPAPSPADHRAVESAVRDEWRRVVARRQWRRSVAGFSVAAALVLVAALVLWDGSNPANGPESAEVARVVRLTGRVSVRSGEAEGEAAMLTAGMPLRSGQSLQTTRESGIALSLEQGISLRVDQDSVVEFVDPHSVKLKSGRVFVDTGSEPGDAIDASPGSRSGFDFEIRTVKGIVRHLGTQYMVRADDEQLKVSVRRGDVRVVAATDGAAPVFVSDGQQLSLTQSGQPELEPTDVHGDEWRWAEELGPGLVLDGRSMDDFLTWVAHETGLELRYGSNEARVAAEQTALHGAVDLPAREALDVVILSSDLVAEIRDGVIEVRKRTIE